MASRVAAPNNQTKTTTEVAFRKRGEPASDGIDGVAAGFKIERNLGIPWPVVRAEVSMPSCVAGSVRLANGIGFQATGIEIGNNRAMATMIQMPNRICCGTRPLIAHRRIPKTHIKQPILQD
jgi:hypothetical protein